MEKLLCEVHSVNGHSACVTLIPKGPGGCGEESPAAGDYLVVQRLGGLKEDHAFRECVVTIGAKNRLVIQATEWPGKHEAREPFSSQELLESLEIGECVMVVGPYQKFPGRQADVKPITMITDGAGLYTLLHVIDALTQQAARMSLWIHRILDVDMLLQGEDFRTRIQKCTGLKTHFYNLPPEEFRTEALGFTPDGRVTAVKLGAMLLPDSPEYLVAGGREFVQETMNDLLSREVLLSDIKHLVIGGGINVRPTRDGSSLSGSA